MKLGALAQDGVGFGNRIRNELASVHDVIASVESLVSVRLEEIGFGLEFVGSGSSSWLGLALNLCWFWPILGLVLALGGLPAWIWFWSQPQHLGAVAL